MSKHKELVGRLRHKPCDIALSIEERVVMKLLNGLMDDAADAIEALEAEVEGLEKKNKFNNAVATTRGGDINRLEREILATHEQLLSLSQVLWEKFYQKASPDFELFDRTDLAVSQIDNMVAGIVEQLERQIEAGNIVAVRLNTCERNYRRLKKQLVQVTKERDKLKEDKERLIGMAKVSDKGYRELMNDYTLLKARMDK